MAASPTRLIITWPKGIQAKGEIRNQYSFVIDLMPTALEVTGTKFMEEVDGVKQMPLDGISLAYSFNKADAPSARTEQYYEQFGNRAMYKDGWKAVTIHGNRMPWVTAGTFPSRRTCGNCITSTRTSPKPTTSPTRIPRNWRS